MRALRQYRNGAAPAKSRRPAIIVRAKPGAPAQGLLRFGPHVFPCALGRGGISARKREGDGATPLARMRVLNSYFRAGQADDMQPRRCRLPMQEIGPNLGWCDAPGDRNYNRPVPLPYRASHERMQREDRLYDLVVVLDWNLSPRQRNRGSAIFLHLARPGFAPTEGCIAVSRRTMARLLPTLSPQSVVQVVR